MNKNRYTVLDSAASLHIPDTLDLFPQVKSQLAQRRTFMQTLRARPALAVLLAFLALILLTGVAYAIGRSLGYMPGIGFVEPGAKIRVLTEPVSQTREDITVTIEQVIVDSQRTVIVYRAEGLSLRAANSQGEGANTYYDNFLRLPDGTLLGEAPLTGYDGTPEPLIDNLTTENGWPNYVRRLVYPAVDPQINELTLVLPALQNMPAGAAPENWEIPFSLKPAPADMTVIPITVLAPPAASLTTDTPSAQMTQAAPLSNVATFNGVTLSLDNVIEVEDGFVFTGKLAWEEAALPPDSNVSMYIAELLTVTDGNGQKVPVEEVPLNAAHDVHESPWSFQTDRKSFAGPLVFSLPQIKALHMPDPFEFELDLGSNPQVGQIWELHREFSSYGQTFQVFSVQLVENASNSDTNFCLVFDLENTEWGGILHDLNPDPVDAGCYDSQGRSYGGTGYGGKPMSIFSQPVGYQNIPSGVHRFSLEAFITHTLSGPWQVAWNPPVTSEPLPTAAPGACLTLDKWKELLDRNDPLPPGLGGKILFSVYDPNSGANFSTLHLAHPDGSELRAVVNGGWSSLSPDGARLGYVNETGLNFIDLATGQAFKLGDDGYNVIWSPDNTRIMYTNTFNLFIANADGSGVQTIDTGSAQVISPVGWLADNQTIVYGAMGGEGFNFKRHNLQTGEMKDLFIVHNKAGFGSVSPDGQWIVFTDQVFGNIGWSIFISRIDGSDRRLVVDADVPTAFISVWSPDGQWLIVNTHKPGDPDGMETPMLVNPFTCQSVRLNAIHGMVEDWSP